METNNSFKECKLTEEEWDEGYNYCNLRYNEFIEGIGYTDKSTCLCNQELCTKELRKSSKCRFSFIMVL